ncbi:hypothetical protein MKX01_001824 [Papaver californicum]|nr:hypothetical protein MKX01_001824 [Papaver californicum]
MDPTLHEAITTGNLDQLRQLFAMKNDVSEYLICQPTATHQNTPLHVAVQHKKKIFVEEICKKCSQPEILIMKQNSEGDTALHIAARLGFSDIVAALIRHLDARGNTSMVQELMMMMNEKKATAMHDAIRSKNDNVRVIKEFIKHSQECWKQLDNSGKNCLHIAAENGSVKVMKYILGKPNMAETMINGEDNQGNTPLHLVLKTQNIKCLRILCRDKRVNKIAVNKENLTAFGLFLRDYQIALTDAQEEFVKKGYKYLSTEGGWVWCGRVCCGRRIKVDKGNGKYEAIADEKIKKLEKNACLMATSQICISFALICAIS